MEPARTLSARLTSAEWREVETAAVKLSMNVSDFTRMALSTAARGVNQVDG